MQNSVQELQAMIKNLHGALTANNKPPRFRGVFNGIPQPDLVGANNKHLILGFGAGQATVDWSKH